MRAERARETDGFPAGMSGSGGSEGSPEGRQPWSNGFVLLPGSINKSNHQQEYYQQSCTLFWRQCLSRGPPLHGSAPSGIPSKVPEP